jgi:phosphopentomutase
MPSQEERERFERSEGRATQATTSGAALPAGYLDDVSRVAAIYQTLGGLEKLVDGLGATTKSHTEKIEQLTQRVYAIPYIKKDVAKNTKELNKLEERHTNQLNRLGQRLGKEIGDLKTEDIGKLNNVAHTAKILGYIALTLAGIIGTAFVTYLFRK